MTTEDTPAGQERGGGTLRDRHEAEKAAVKAELEQAQKQYTPEELRAAANRQFKPLPADIPAENLRALRLVLDSLRDPNITMI